jgi:hypothetical protein
VTDHSNIDRPVECRLALHLAGEEAPRPLCEILYDIHATALAMCKHPTVFECVDPEGDYIKMVAEDANPKEAA